MADGVDIDLYADVDHEFAQVNLPGFVIALHSAVYNY